jgi:hypothetical protein
MSAPLTDREVRPGTGTVTIEVVAESDGPTEAQLIVPASMLGLPGGGTVVLTAHAG